MQLTNDGFKEKVLWQEKGYSLPTFDLEKIKQNTRKNPRWIHFGAGNIFRAFHANLAQKMIEKQLMDTGIVVAEGFDYEIIEKMNHPHDELSILVTLKADGTVDKKVIGSITDSFVLDSQKKNSFARLKEFFANPSLQMATFTITEKGYSLTDGKGEIFDVVNKDYRNGPSSPDSYIGKVTSLLYARFKAGRYPIAMVSTDNCSHNGDKLFHAVEAFAKKWVENEKADADFLEYISDKNLVSFPWSMIDKITPRPDVGVEAILKADGVEGLDAIITEKNTYVAPFVNAEEAQYLVIEDAFPNGRPALEACGVIFTTKETVDRVERMKVCTCLNPLHTALAVYGCLLGYRKISDEMKDAALKKLVEGIGYVEGLPVVSDPGVIRPKEFLDTVLLERIPNPFMPDTPQRIATDTSQKLAIRFGETVKAYQKNAPDKVAHLTLIPLVFAGWIRYLMAIDDEGNRFELSPDPLLSLVCPYAQKLSLSESVDTECAIRELLHMEKLWGMDLYEANLASKVIGYVEELTDGIGAVRRTLDKYVSSIRTE